MITTIIIIIIIIIIKIGTWKVLTVYLTTNLRVLYHGNNTIDQADQPVARCPRTRFPGKAEKEPRSNFETGGQFIYENMHYISKWFCKNVLY